MRVNIKKVERLLTTWGAEVKSICPLKGDSIDIEALQKLSETKTLIEALKAEGVEDRKHLMDLGFMAGSMILIF